MKLLLSVLTAIAAIALAPHNAQASSYSSTSGLTQLTINELPVFDPLGIDGGAGAYIAKIGTTNWSGRFSAPTVTTSGGTTSYTGTFQDSPVLAGTTILCKGTIKLDRTLVAGQYNLSVKWTITGGAGCPFIGNNPTLRLKESLPIANASGDFNPSNSTTQFREENTRGIWGQWKVTNSTGLNCRATPALGGAIVRTLPVSTLINVAKFDSSNKWLQVYFSTTSKCHVRANSAYIRPAQIPF